MKRLNEYIFNYNVYKDPFKPRIGPNALFFLETWFKEKIAAERTKQENENVLANDHPRYEIKINQNEETTIERIKRQVSEKKRSKVNYSNIWYVT